MFFFLIFGQYLSSLVFLEKQEILANAHETRESL